MEVLFQHCSGKDSVGSGEDQSIEEAAMIRVSRALKENTAYFATFVSLIALVACSAAEDGAGGSSAVPGFGGELPQTTNPISPANGAGVEPANTDTTPGEMAQSGEGMSGDVPFVAPSTDGDGDGDGAGILQ